MSAQLSERIGELVIPATVQCTTPETNEDDLRTLTVYGAWTPGEQLEYAGTTAQALYARARQHRCDAWRDETCCPLYRTPLHCQTVWTTGLSAQYSNVRLILCGAAPREARLKTS
jgi:hypothetical protein